jgi:hypothetical protein
MFFPFKFRALKQIADIECCPDLLLVSNKYKQSAAIINHEKIGSR